MKLRLARKIVANLYAWPWSSRPSSRSTWSLRDDVPLPFNPHRKYNRQTLVAAARRIPTAELELWVAIYGGAHG
jgi:hypothetical protein